MADRDSTGLVTVACKMPRGIVLHIDEMIDGTEPVLGGGTRKIKQARQKGPTYTLNGPAHAIDKAPTCLIVGGYALTPGIPREFWEEWMRQNKDSPMVQNRVIFAYESRDHVEGQAREQAEVRSGLEPIVPDSDPRLPKRRRQGGSPTSGVSALTSFQGE